MKQILSVDELPLAWYRVFKRVTRYSYIERACLEAHVIFRERIKGGPNRPIATIREILDAGIDVVQNANNYGIPQGTPISASLSNLYMLECDRDMSTAATKYDAFYRRYSDDIMIICSPDSEIELASLLHAKIAQHKLVLNVDKTERTEFDGSVDQIIQYLGFNLGERDALIRQSSLSRKWRSFRKSLRRIQKIGRVAVISGKSSKIYTSSLHERFQPVGARNFSSYARKSAKAFGSSAILKQIRRFERVVAKALRELNPPKKK